MSVAPVTVEATAVEVLPVSAPQSGGGEGQGGGERARERAREQVNVTKLGGQLISLGPSDLAIAPAIRKPMQMVKIQVKMRAGHSSNARTFCLM